MGTKDWFRNKSASRKNSSGPNKHIMGCITGLFHWFHFHRASLFTTRCDGHAALFAAASTSTNIESVGVKPPRNSLELDLDHLIATATTASEDYDIPFSCVEVRKARTGGGNIVAKLMGLEYLPNDTNIIDNYNLDQPRRPMLARNSNVEEDDIRRGTRSSPETPARMSLASRQSWDSDPRTSSVQKKSYCGGNKENLSILAVEELKLCRFQDYSSSPAPAPAPAMKNIKVQNSCSSSPRRYTRDIVKQMKERVSRRIEKSRSPIDSLQRLPALAKKKTEKPPSVQKEGSTFRPKSVTKLSPMTECKNVRCDRFNERVSSSLRNPRRFIRMNPQMPIIDVRREDVIPLLLPQPPPPVHPPPQLEPAELQYVKRVLESAFIRRGRPRSDYSLDPIIFHELELSSTVTNNHSRSQLRHRCNRKLLFDLIKEIMISEQLSKKVNKNIILDRIWSKIRRSPQLKCETMEDVDALIRSDLRDVEIRKLVNHHAVEEEADLIADELENTIIDYLVVEMCYSKLGRQ